MGHRRGDVDGIVWVFEAVALGATSMANMIEHNYRPRLGLSRADKTALIEVIWRWTLRLILPVILGAAGVLFYWVWLDGDHTMVPLRVLGMVPMSVSFGAVAIWTVKEWLPPSDNHRKKPVPASGNRAGLDKVDSAVLNRKALIVSSALESEPI
jgi:hypothetical protein